VCKITPIFSFVKCYAKNILFFLQDAMLFPDRQKAFHLPESAPEMPQNGTFLPDCRQQFIHHQGLKGIDLTNCWFDNYQGVAPVPFFLYFYQKKGNKSSMRLSAHPPILISNCWIFDHAIRVFISDMSSLLGRPRCVVGSGAVHQIERESAAI
jgi:hypothetical protein